MSDLVAAALAINQDFLALGNEVFQAEGGRFVRDRAAPGVYQANFIDTVTAASPREIDALLTRAAREYSHCRHLRFDLDSRTTPEFEARLRLDSAWSCQALATARISHTSALSATADERRKSHAIHGAMTHMALQDL